LRFISASPSAIPSSPEVSSTLPKTHRQFYLTTPRTIHPLRLSARVQRHSRLILRDSITKRLRQLHPDKYQRRVENDTEKAGRRQRQGSNGKFTKFPVDDSTRLPYLATGYKYQSSSLILTGDTGLAGGNGNLTFG
jgi:hypothetical protein